MKIQTHFENTVVTNNKRLLEIIHNSFVLKLCTGWHVEYNENGICKIILDYTSDNYALIHEEITKCVKLLQQEEQQNLQQ